ncbi:hypothetical protein [Paraburkholderia sp. 31.1]|uniref:hypothetical protein n=1 Tax=Paraburkholderia sp. 31.1 TaxID=2615205 RepID=UPI0016564278|nr:hypothetical protein [Paraburkholderia sp. 31.1]
MANSVLGGSTTDYRVYYQNNGRIYASYMIRSGTTMQIAHRSEAVRRKSTTAS